jgi:hypothetical protein
LSAPLSLLTDFRLAAKDGLRVLNGPDTYVGAIVSVAEV